MYICTYIYIYIYIYIYTHAIRSSSERLPCEATERPLNVGKQTDYSDKPYDLLNKYFGLVHCTDFSIVIVI